MNEIVKLIDNLLPATISKYEVQYSEIQNMLVNIGYTSAAGNSYFNGIRLSERIFIEFYIGIGVYHKFINGFSIYSHYQSEQRKSLGSKYYYAQVYNENKIKKDATEIVFECLKKEAQKENSKIDLNDLETFAVALVEETYKNQIETIKNMQLNNLLIK